MARLVSLLRVTAGIRGFAGRNAPGISTETAGIDPVGQPFRRFKYAAQKGRASSSFFGIFFARSWNALSGHTTATPTHPALPSDPQGIRRDCKEIRRGVVKPQGQRTEVSCVTQGTRLHDQRAEIRCSTPA
jgi:hypothetical protein